MDLLEKEKEDLFNHLFGRIVLVGSNDVAEYFK